VIQTPKFYFADVGVVNHLARRGRLEPGGELFGAAFENWVFHELSAFASYRRPDTRLAYWRLASGVEVDFIIDEMQVAIEAKATRSAHADHVRGLRALAEDQKVGRRILVSLDLKPRRTDDGIDILPARDFVARLWHGEIVAP
jgi:uncharacterized protein